VLGRFQWGKQRRRAARKEFARVVSKKKETSFSYGKNSSFKGITGITSTENKKNRKGPDLDLIKVRKHGLLIRGGFSPTTTRGVYSVRCHKGIQNVRRVGQDSRGKKVSEKISQESKPKNKVGGREFRLEKCSPCLQFFSIGENQGNLNEEKEIGCPDRKSFRAEREKKGKLLRNRLKGIFPLPGQGSGRKPGATILKEEERGNARNWAADQLR